MKNKFIIIAVAIPFIAATVSVSLQGFKGKSKAIYEANIEALADEESGGGIINKFCFKAGSLGGDKYLCSERTHVSQNPGIPFGPIDSCKFQITPTFGTRVGYCFVPE